MKEYKSKEEMQQDEKILLHRVVVEVSELSLGAPLSLRLTEAFSDLAKFKERFEGKNWLEKTRKQYRKR